MSNEIVVSFNLDGLANENDCSIVPQEKYKLLQQYFRSTMQGLKMKRSAKRRSSGDRISNLSEFLQRANYMLVLNVLPMFSSNSQKSILVPLSNELIMNETDSYQEILKRIKTLYSDIPDEFAGDIALKYIRIKLKDDPIGLIKTIRRVEPIVFDKFGVNNPQVTTEPLSHNPSNLFSNNVETTTGENVPKTVHRENMHKISKSECFIPFTIEPKNTADTQRNEILIQPAELSYEDFLNLTNIEEGIRDDIIKKFPKDFEKYLARIDKFIRRYYENNFVYEAQWPDKVKFHDRSIRTMDDLNRAKERLLANQAAVQIQVDEINSSPDLFPSSGECRDESSQQRELNLANHGSRVGCEPVDSDSQKGSRSSTAKKICNENISIPIDVSQSCFEMEILGPSLPQLHKEEIVQPNIAPNTISQDQSSGVNNTTSHCEKISILPRELSYDDFRNFTNIESYVRDNIKKKFPNSKNFLVPIDIYVKNLIEGDFIHCNEWPEFIKFNDPTIRTLADLHRLKEQIPSEMHDGNMNSEIEPCIVDDNMLTTKNEGIEPIQFLSTNKNQDLDYQLSDLPNEESKHYGQTESNSQMEEHVNEESHVSDITNFKSRNNNDLAFCDIANFTNNILSQETLSQAIDPLQLKDEYLNCMNVSSSGSSIISSDTVLFNRRSTTSPCFAEVNRNEQQLEHKEIPDVNFAHKLFSVKISADEKSFFSESPNTSFKQKSSETSLEIVSNEELNVLRDLCRKLDASQDAINHDSIDIEDEELENATDMESLKSYIKRLSEILLTSRPAEKLIENPVVPSQTFVDNIVSPNEVADDKIDIKIKQEINASDCYEITENCCLDSTSDVIFIENDPTIPIVIEDSDNATQNLVAKMMNISGEFESTRNSFCDNAVTTLQNKEILQLPNKSVCEDKVEIMDISPNRITCDNELVIKPRLKSNVCNINSSPAAKRKVGPINKQKNSKKPRQQSDITNKHAPKKTNKKNSDKPPKKRTVKYKIIDGIEVPIVPQITHNFRPLQLYSLSKHEKNNIRGNKSTLSTTLKLSRNRQKTIDSKIRKHANEIEVHLPHNPQPNVSNVLHGRNLIAEIEENSNILLNTELPNASDLCINETEKMMETTPLYQYVSASQINWITLLKLRGFLNKGHFRISYENNIPLLGSHENASVESKVLIRTNEFLCIDICGVKMRLQFKWTKIDSNLIKTLSMLLFTPSSNNYMTGNLIQLRAFEIILNQFRKYLKLSIRVEEQHREFILSSSIDKAAVRLSSKLFIRNIIKAIELCQAFNEPT